MTRPVLDAVLPKECCRAERFEHWVSLMLIDIDNLSAINEAHGYGVGDRILERAGILMRAYFREHDWVARFAEDTIAVLLPETTPADAISLAERTRTMIEDRLTFRDYRTERRIVVTVSVAVASARALEGEPIDHVKCVGGSGSGTRAGQDGRAQSRRARRTAAAADFDRRSDQGPADDGRRRREAGLVRRPRPGQFRPLRSPRTGRGRSAGAPPRIRVASSAEMTGDSIEPGRAWTADGRVGWVRIRCMARILIAAALLTLAQASHPGTPFNPWGHDGYRTVNAIEFAPGRAIDVHRAGDRARRED